MYTLLIFDYTVLLLLLRSSRSLRVCNRHISQHSPHGWRFSNLISEQAILQSARNSTNGQELNGH